MVDLVDILVAIVAVYGAVLSTYMLVRRIRSDRFNIFVTHGWAYSLSDNSMDKSPKSLTISAVNHGAREVVIESLCLEIPSFCRITPMGLELMNGGSCPNNKYPVEKTRLKCGDQIEASFDYAALSKILTQRGFGARSRIRAVCEDTLENVYASAWFEMGLEAENL